MKIHLKRLAAAIIQTAEEQKDIDLSQLTDTVAQLLSERGQLRLMRALGPYLEAAYNELHGIVPVHIAVASEQSPDSLKELTETLKQTLHKEIDLRMHVRPELIGGMRVSVKDDQFDFSLLSELRSAATHLSSPRS